MRIKTNHYEVYYDAQKKCIIFRGSLLLCGVEDYIPIIDLLEHTLNENLDNLTINIKELDFLNSSGITMFTNFAVRGRKVRHFNLTLIGQKQIAWQPRLAINLQRIIPKCTVKLS